VAVDGRAQLVEAFDAEPTVTIRMDALQFTRVAGGRPMTEARPAAIEFGGDAEAAQRIVDNLAYVI
jgi:hypothetical protein